MAAAAAGPSSGPARLHRPPSISPTQVRFPRRYSAQAFYSIQAFYSQPLPCEVVGAGLLSLPFAFKNTGEPKHWGCMLLPTLLSV